MIRTILSVAAAAAAGAALLATATSSPSAASEPTPAPKPVASTYTIDPGHSAILFRCKHLGVAYQWGRFDSFEGSFTLDEDVSKSSVTVKVDAASVNSNSKDRDEHLRGPDFFDVKQFAEMTFQSTEVEKKGDDEFTVTGELSLHGVTKSVTMDVQKIGESDTRMGRRAGFEGTFEIDRMDYGIKTYPDMLGKDVRMTFAIEGLVDGGK